MLLCVNFLLNEGFTQPINTLTAEKTREWQEGSIPIWINTELEKWPTNSSGEFFRNVSFYSVGSNTIQTYTKSSYSYECDSALKSGYRYLFGKRYDTFIDTNYKDLISTMICLDLFSKVRSNQESLSTLIHVFQSNTHTLSDYLPMLDRKAESYSMKNIPGNPEIIIHADPLNQDLFLQHEVGEFTYSSDRNFDVSAKKTYVSEPPKQTYTISLKKQNHNDSYIIKYWLLLPESSSILK